MTIDNLARLTILGMSIGLLALCLVVIHRARWAWRIVVANALWAVSLIGWMSVSILVTPRPIELINWWSRCNIIYSIIMAGLMLWLHYAIKGKGNGSGGN